MKKRMQLIFVLLTLIGLLLPSNIALSQGDDPDLLSMRGINIVWQMGLTTSLGGKDDANTLRSIRDREQRSFDDMIASFEDEMAEYKRDEHPCEIAKVLRKARMNFLDKQIKLAEERARQSSFAVNYVIYIILTDGADSMDENMPIEPNPVIDKILPILQKQTKQNATDMLYGHIASRIPGSGAAISSSSPSQIYNVDAGLPPSSAPPIVSEDGAGSSGNPDDANNPLLLKPLRFTNTGLYDATVLVASYTPAAGVNASMSRASTVVFRDSNPSAYLDLPLGTYVFCYYWDLGTDVDKDGYVDYAHRNTGNVILSGDPTDNTGSGQVVTLNPKNMNNPNGKCGETASPASENALSLTPQELANQGTHTYTLSCACNGGSPEVCDFWSGDDYDPFVATVDFVKGGFILGDENGASEFHQKLAVNTYSYTDEMIDGELTFTDGGMVYSDNELICTVSRR